MPEKQMGQKGKAPAFTELLVRVNNKDVSALRNPSGGEGCAFGVCTSALKLPLSQSPWALARSPSVYFLSSPLGTQALV